MQRLRSSFLLALSLALSACSGGGGGGGAPLSNGIGGNLLVIPTDATVLEAEPNNSPDTAHVLGDLNPGGSINVVGSVVSGANNDDVDGFLITAPNRVSITLALTATDQLSDLDVLILDAVSMQVVETFATPNANESGTFVASGSFFLVVEAFDGASEYSLSLSAIETQGPLTQLGESGPPKLDRYLGEFVGSDSLVVRGNFGLVDNACFTLALPEGGLLSMQLEGLGNQFGLEVSNGTMSLQTPIPMQTLSSVSASDTRTVSLSGMSLVSLRVVPLESGAGDWTLSLQRSATNAQDASAPLELSPLPRASVESGGRYSSKSSAAMRFAEPAHEMMNGDVIVCWDGQAENAVTRDQSLLQRGGRVQLAVPSGPRKVHFDLPPGLSEREAQRYTVALAASLRSFPGLRYAEPDFRQQPLAVQGGVVEPTDSFYNLQWHYPAIQLPAAWAMTTGDPGVIVAILDTGSTPHPDLDDRYVQGIDLISSASIAGDGDGIDSDPFDVGDSQGVQPSSYHGSHVGGTVGAETGNGTGNMAGSGAAGVTWFGGISHVRVLGIGGGSGFDILNGILWSAGLQNSSGSLPNQSADIINMSLGGGGFSQATQDACTAAHNAGAVLIAAAGNENSGTPSFPAAYDDVISVAALDQQANRAPYSNFHASVDIAAPGGNTAVDSNGDSFIDGVLSPRPDDSVNPTDFTTYAFYQGTSMAAPHVAGVAALVLAMDPNLSPDQVELILRTTATDLGAPGNDDLFGDGMVNAFAAVQMAAGGGSGMPSLSLSSSNVLFDSPDSSQNVSVANVGGSILNVNPPSIATNTGGDWLSASLNFIQNPVSSDTASVSIQVDGSNLPDGLYTGSVTLSSNGGSGTIGVNLVIGGEGSIQDRTVFVLAIDANSDTLETISQIVVQTSSSLAYGFADLPPGDYLIVAGTDENNDGLICDPTEPLCGIYPSLEGASVLTVVDGENIFGIDFPLTEATFDPASADAPDSDRPTFRLLDWVAPDADQDTSKSSPR